MKEIKAVDLLNIFESENIKEEDLSELVVKALIEKSKKIATAESCTGGLVSSKITDISGASSVFDCGVCSYANFIKQKVVGVKEETLSAYGAVSEKTAMEMARGVRLLSGADIGVSTTGVAGPLGGTQYKPVGLVYIGISTKDGLYAKKLMLSDVKDKSRERIREMSCYAALYFALRELEKL